MARRAEPARVVGRIEGDPDEASLAEALARLLPADRPGGLRVDWRDPAENARIVAEDHLPGLDHATVMVTDWHQDGLPGEAPEAMLLWSNREPTEVRELGTGRALGPFRPGDVVLVMNLLCEHRVPPNPSPDRCLARVYDVDPGWFP